VILFVTDIYESKMNHEATFERLKKTSIPVILLINKIDQADQARMEERIDYWAKEMPNAEILPISALEGFNLEPIKKRVLELIPESPPYYGKEEISDRPMRFFVSEMIREKIFLHYKKEIPYACQVEVEEYIEDEKIIRIRAIIYVERNTQKGIVIGHQGNKLKHVGIDARKDIQKFVEKHVHLELFVKVDKDWREDKGKLERHGY
jgi:GTP-binding protein Era